MAFPPVYGPDSRTLIVGTWPSPKSREQGFFYGHPQNRFWPLLARLLGAPVPQSVPEKKALIRAPLGLCRSYPASSVRKCS